MSNFNSTTYIKHSVCGKRSLLVALVTLFTCICATGQQPFNWAKAVVGSGEGETNSIAVDAWGNVYHCGYFGFSLDFDPGPGTAMLTASGQTDVYIAKYDNNGNYLWAKQLGGTDNDWGQQILVDDEGNIYVAGMFTGLIDLDPGSGVDTVSSSFGTNTGAFFAKFDSAGNHIWGNAIRTSLGGSNSKKWMAIDNAGNISVTGGYFVNLDLDPGAGVAIHTSNGGGMFLAKYDNNGNYLHSFIIQAYSGPIGVDLAANIYISGAFVDSVDFDPGAGISYLHSPGEQDGFFAKYDSAGNFQWAKQLDKSIFFDVAISDMGHLCGSGSFNTVIDFDPGPGIANLTATGPNDGYFAHYDSDGNYIYAKALHGVANIRQLELDASGNLYTSGILRGTADFDPGPGVYNLTGVGFQDVDMFYAVYNDVGNLTFVYQFGGPGPEETKAIVLDAANNTYVSGGFTQTVDFDPGPGTANLTCQNSLSPFVVKYGNASLQTGILKKSAEVLIYPNPTSDFLRIETTAKLEQIKVTDAVGRLMLTSNGEEIYLGEYRNGMYFLQVRTSEGSFTTKVIKE